MIYVWEPKFFQSDAFPQCFPLRYGPPGVLIPVADVTAIRCTARNLATNAIINSRNNQSVLNVNGGTYALNANGEPEFRMFFSAADTAIVGSALTTPRETHTFQFRVTMTNGTIGTFEFSIECLALPATQLNEAFDLGYIRQMLRIMIDETNSKVPDNDWIDALLQRGANAANDLINYHVGDSSITLVAGTSEYDFPPEFQKVLWAAWNGRPLAQSGQQEQRTLGNWYQDDPPGPPTKYLLWGRTLIVSPTPDAATVAVSPTLTLRGVTTPAPFRLNGFTQLSSQHYEVPVYAAGSEWAFGPMGRNPVLGKAYWNLFQGRAAACKSFYERHVTL